MLKLICFFLLGLALCQGFYVPGTYPVEFKVNATIQAQVNSLTSFDTDMPYDYYSMPFCKPPEGVKDIPFSANPGSLIEGNRLKNSPYNFSVKVTEIGRVSCFPTGFYPGLSAKEVKGLAHKIDNHYRVNMVLDNLPVTMYDLLNKESEFVRPGYTLGFKKNGKYYINNHLAFNILIYRTHGEYTLAKDRFDASVFFNGLDSRRRHLLTSDDVSASSSSSSSSSSLRRMLVDAVATAAKTSAAVPSSASPPVAKASTSPLDSSPSNDDPEYYMVVGFEVSPCSVKLAPPSNPNALIKEATCSDDDEENVSKWQEIKEGEKIVYTYSVYWQESDIRWASRWDAYLRMPGGKVHVFSILNSLLVVILMASAVAVILLRTLRRDLARYDQVASSEGIEMGSGVGVGAGAGAGPGASVGSAGSSREESGWKLLAGDVFRAPLSSGALAVHVGTGVQVISTWVLSLCLAAFGFLSPASRGALLSAAIFIFVILSCLGGFVTVWVWGMTQRSYNHWYGVAARTSVQFPGIIMLIFTVLNTMLAKAGSTGAVPAGAYFFLVAMWFLVSIPLTFVGGSVALRVPILVWPVKTNQIPRHIPAPSATAKPVALFLLAGLLPFATVFVELYFAMTSLWLGYFYYLFGFVFLVMVLSVIVVAEVGIMGTYAQLCSEDYTWWWNSFYRGGSMALYLFAFSVMFLFSTLGNLQGFLPVAIYLSHMLIISLGVYVSMGTIGFLSSLLFVYKIFAAVKHE
eukprot:CAMPEP_0175052398 /NCGR_PEP_ID=MMETSP0052_2-20121109/8340_1 /TAXON_ID=51329 ORGANISM="Polytomella parva, Strain SAG 63-3" /NCGR_SAMPLE_ID=MMETSP0052_2 /ASSEMBLY_ACC=CAM_ASM_000194 /LENGTH=743 /DNA_ID=CAMNT_0016316803 /DNA_START=18 /DNA_END=2249 /DNA_ORIENTATION=-